MPLMILGASRGIGFACLKKASLLKDQELFTVSRSVIFPLVETCECPPFSHKGLDLGKIEGIDALKSHICAQGDCRWSVIFAMGTNHGPETDLGEQKRLLNFYCRYPIEIVETIMEENPRQEHTFVFIGSSAVWHKKANKAYIDAKAELHRLVAKKGIQYAKNGSLLCGVAPAAVSGYDNRWDRCRKEKPEVWQNVASEQAISRFQTPDEIAEKITWILQARPMNVAGKMINMDDNVTYANAGISR
jgi:hypothetical protein